MPTSNQLMSDDAASGASAVSPPERGIRKEFTGTVVSAKMNKTIVVEIVSRVPHPKFKKIIKKSHKFYVHDEKGEAQEGDKVRISETRPLSKLKRWRLVEILKH